MPEPVVWVPAASETGAGSVGVGRAILASTDTASASSVTSSTEAVRVDAGVGLVGHVGVVRARGVRANVGAGVGAGVRSTVAASHAGAGGVGAVAASETGAGSVSVGRAVLASTDTASAGSVASSAVAVRVDTRVGLVGKLGVVRTGGVAVVSAAASEAAAGVVAVTAVSQAST